MLTEQRKKLAESTRKKETSQEVVKLRVELEKAEREQNLMAMIVDNYEKEIAKKSTGTSGGQHTSRGDQGGTLGFRNSVSANQLHNLAVRTGKY